jgi:hypothetical protein
MPDSGLEKGPPPVLLTLDREGRWFHEGLPVLHPGLVSVLNRHLVVDDDGSVEVRVPNHGFVERALVTVEELPYYVTSVSPGAPLTVRLNDETEEHVSLSDVWLVGDDRLYCRVKGGRHAARFRRDPYLALAACIEDDGRGGWLLASGGAREPLRVEAAPPAWPPRSAP